MNGLEQILVFGDVLSRLASYAPVVLAAILLMLIGWVVGKIIGKITRSLLQRLKADRYFKFGRGFEISNIFGLIVSWIIYLAFIQAAVQVLGVQALTEFVGQILSFVPRLLEGMVIIIVGYIMAKYVQGQVIATKVEYSELIGRVIFFLTVIIVISLALPFFGIDPYLINNIVLILVGSVGLGIAIALGLGLKETIARLAKKYSKKL
jgi:hypothetical protein